MALPAMNVHLHKCRGDGKTLVLTSCSCDLAYMTHQESLSIIEY